LHVLEPIADPVKRSFQRAPAIEEQLCSIVDQDALASRAMSRRRRLREPPPGRAYDKVDPRRSMLRVLIALAVGAAFALVPLPGDGFAIHLVAGWDAAGVTLLGIITLILLRMGPGETQRRAVAEDPGRRAASVLVLLASTFSLFAAAVVLRKAKTLAPGGESLFVVLCLLAVVTAWGLTHASYAPRYAHLYYRDEPQDPVGGLTFPGDAPPDAFDFRPAGRPRPAVTRKRARANARSARRPTTRRHRSRRRRGAVAWDGRSDREVLRGRATRPDPPEARSAAPRSSHRTDAR
jgi:uncharacterized membrane protein